MKNDPDKSRVDRSACIAVEHFLITFGHALVHVHLGHEVVFLERAHQTSEPFLELAVLLGSEKPRGLHGVDEESNVCRRELGVLEPYARGGDVELAPRHARLRNASQVGSEGVLCGRFLLAKTYLHDEANVGIG